MKNKKTIACALGILSYMGIIKISTPKYINDELEDIIEGLEQEDITKIDEYLRNIHIESYYSKSDQIIDNSYDTTIEELEKEYLSGYLNNKKEKCNDSLKKIIKETLEAEIIEGYNLNKEKLKNFEIIGRRLYSKDGETYRDKYGVIFTYEDKYYELYADNKKAYSICYAYRALGYNELSIEEMDEYYQMLKEILMSKITKKEKTGEWEYYNKENKLEKIEYDGLFKIKEDKEKEKVVKKYLKTLNY